MKKRLKVLLLFNTPYNTPRGYDFTEEFSDPDNMYTENDVSKALRANGHTVSPLGLYKDVRPLFEEIDAFKPDVIFNLMDGFNDRTHLDSNAAGLLEMIGIPYTGAPSGSLFICNDKALSKKILRFHRVRVPRFGAFYRGRRVWLPSTLKLPCVIKPLGEEASRGISLASVVDSNEGFVERIKFIHNNMGADAIAEEYVEGRELYISVIGYKRIRVLPPREMKFGQLPEDEPRIATYKAKWDEKYRERWGIGSAFAGKLADGVMDRIEDVCKRAYRALNFRSYARFDVRVTQAGQVYVLEPNANPCIARLDEVAQSADKVGIPYEELIRNIVAMAFLPKH